MGIDIKKKTGWQWDHGGIRREKGIRDCGGSFRVDPAWTHHPWAPWVDEVSQH